MAKKLSDETSIPIGLTVQPKRSLSRLIFSLDFWTARQGKYTHVTQASPAALFVRLVRVANNYFFQLTDRVADCYDRSTQAIISSE